MHYLLRYSSPHQHYLDIEFRIDHITTADVTLQLPSWRPGRYELGNFAKNVQQFDVRTSDGKPLPFEKIGKDTWKVLTKGSSSLLVHYNYYAAELNAGSTYLDSQQLYVNPVNCLLYIPGRVHEPCHLNVMIPIHYNLACSLEKKQEKEFSQDLKIVSLTADDFHELADSPFIASSTLQHQYYQLSGCTFHVWFNGECQPVWDRVLSNFSNFTKHQLQIFGDIPVKDYHFLIQVLPYRFYHGVEHLESTVIALGPGHSLMHGNVYKDLLGVCSHELFHCWNIKTIRPAEMHPYDYARENYSCSGYVYEGVTTYYGDLELFRSHVFSEKEYWETFNERLQKHMDSFGRKYLSVAASSYDTWLDGYVPGVPNRKTSIYDEGCLIAFITDILIRQHSHNQHSLDDVMRFLYQEFGKKNKGYTEADYKGIVEHYANASLEHLFVNYINGTHDYEPLLINCLHYIGYSIQTFASSKWTETYWGFKTIDNAGITKVSSVYPGSTADKAGIGIGDEIVAINGYRINNDLNEWAAYYGDQPLELQLNKAGKITHVKIETDGRHYYKIYKVERLSHTNREQEEAFETWRN